MGTIFFRRKRRLPGTPRKDAPDMKQVVAKIMASGHTRGMRHESGSCFTGPPCLCGTSGMGSIKNKISTILSKKTDNFSLRSRKTIDIKPIAQINVLAIDPRHCSTTFYQ
jgi:hypothetical protein